MDAFDVLMQLDAACRPEIDRVRQQSAGDAPGARALVDEAVIDMDLRNADPPQGDAEPEMDSGPEDIAASFETYHPVSPFRLTFTFAGGGGTGGDGSYHWETVAVHDPVFIWQYTDESGNLHVEEQEAEVGSLDPSKGEVYLNYTLEAKGDPPRPTGRLASCEVSNDKGSGVYTYSVLLYRLDKGSGAISDYRHALITLGYYQGGSAAADKGCWRIVAETVEAEGATCTIHYIDRQFFCVGGIIHEGEDKTTLESLVEAGTPFIAAKITTSGSDYSAAIVGFKNFAAMKHASLDRTFSLIPLYELQPQKNAGGEGKKEEEADSVPVVVVTDFRAMPLVQAFELPTLGGVV